MNLHFNIKKKILRNFIKILLKRKSFEFIKHCMEFFFSVLPLCKQRAVKSNIVNSITLEKQKYNILDQPYLLVCNDTSLLIYRKITKVTLFYIIFNMEPYYVITIFIAICYKHTSTLRRRLVRRTVVVIRPSYALAPHMKNIFLQWWGSGGGVRMKNV